MLDSPARPSRSLFLQLTLLWSISHPPGACHPLSLSCFHACHLPIRPHSFPFGIALSLSLLFLQPFSFSLPLVFLSTPTSPAPTSSQGVVARHSRFSTAFPLRPRRFRVVPSPVNVRPTVGPLEVSRDNSKCWHTIESDRIPLFPRIRSNHPAHDRQRNHHG
ncbi:hypothetical protein BGZ63DRAFT_257918 [Mariannaea sp. PMI_226]|nr:hypothetical protein BGZ63DRAFT_257918 [Mariannaea sp. PMI_226]